MDSAAASSSSSSSTDGVLKQPHVLIVDDSRVTLRLYEMIFKRHSPCTVTTAESGVEALEFLGLLLEEKQSSENDNVPKVSLITLDYEMPGMNGYEFLKKIKESSSHVKDVPVVIVSSTSDPTVINKCLEAGALKFITKPLKISDVEDLMTSKM